MHVCAKIHYHPLSENWYVLINSLSGALDVVPSAVAAALRAGDQHLGKMLSAETLEHLMNRGYILSSPQEEQEIISAFAAASAKHFTGRFQINFCPTFRCNIACTYCFERELHEQLGSNSSLMTLDQVRHGFALVDSIVAERSLERVAIGLFGGEPLQHLTVPVVEEIIRQAADRKYTVGIASNGVDVEPFLDLFTRPGVKVLLKITLDGPEHVHDRRRRYKNGKGTHAQIVHHISRLLEAEVPVELQINLDRENIEHVRDTLLAAEMQGWPLFPHFSCVLSRVHDRTLFAGGDVLREDLLLAAFEQAMPDSFMLKGWLRINFLNVLRQPAMVLEPQIPGLFAHPMVHHCEAVAGASLFLGPDGLMYACPSAIGSPELAVGRFSPSVAWDPVMRGRWDRSVEHISQCKDCAISLLCGGGCAIRALRDSGDLQAADCNQATEILDSYLTRHRSTLRTSVGER